MARPLQPGARPHELGHPERALELARRIQREAPPADPMVAQARKLESNLQEAAARRN
ncbi:hypothetical protein ACN28S_47385 [Cystobacter fuscus]